MNPSPSDIGSPRAPQSPGKSASLPVPPGTLPREREQLIDQLQARLNELRAQRDLARLLYLQTYSPAALTRVTAAESAMSACSEELRLAMRCD